MRTRACVLLGVVALASGCGGGGSNAKDALSKTAANLGKIRSGTLHVQLLVTPTGKSLGGATGFLIDGPFELSSGKHYPEAAISYTQLAAGKRATVRVISTGTGGVVIAGGKAHPLAPAQLEELRAAAAPGGGVGRVVLDRWLRNPNLSDGGEVGGASTDRVRADLDVVQAANGLLALAPGTHARRLEGANANRLAKAVRSARFEPKAWFRAVYAGEEPVGFVMLYEDPVGEGDRGPDGPGRAVYYLWRFMIDERHQRRGYGRRALELVVEHVREQPGARDLLVSVVPREDSAERLYASAGFRRRARTP